MSTNTTASATDISCSFGWITLATAAIALPPQIAVPTAMSSGVSPGTRSTAAEHEPERERGGEPCAVSSAPLDPTRHTSSRFMPAPSATTPSCNVSVVHFFVCFGGGVPVPSATASPASRASQLGAPSPTSAAPATTIRAT